MRKSILFVVALVMSTVANAVELGDFITNDPSGVPGIVVYVDNSGEHGLMISPKAFTEDEYKEFVKSTTKSHNYIKKQEQKQLAKKIKKGIDVSMEEAAAQAKEERYNLVMQWQENAPRISYPKKKRQIPSDVAGQTTGRGEENMRIIANYCQANDLDLAQYFPIVNWAIQLGNGWFIPGTEELELMLLNRGFQGLGKKYNMGMKELMDASKSFAVDMQELQETGRTSNKGLMMGRNIVSGFSAFGMFSLLSSTMEGSDWVQQDDNIEKTVTIIGGTSDIHYVLTNITDKLGATNYWAFGYGLNAEIAAFKRF